MGSAQSTPAPPSTSDPEKQRDFVDTTAFLAALAAPPVSPNGSLTLSNLASWESKINGSPKSRLARTILQHSDISTALTTRSAFISDPHVFNTQLDFKTGPITSQKSSGRCWLFASTNVFRYEVMRKLKLEDFQLSQSYLFFFDKLNKANYYLESSIELADRPLDDRVVNFLSSDLISDGGQWDMVVNLVENYGLVPQSVFPESTHSSLSGPLNALLKTKLREHALILRRASANLRAQSFSPEAISRALRLKKEDLMKEVYTIMTATLGVPPGPHEKFSWDYYDADGKPGHWEGTAKDFAKEFVSKPYAPQDSFSLINDPRNEYSKLYTVDRLGNVFGGRPVLYVNTEIGNMKTTVVKMIKAGIPVFFGCDVGKFSSRVEGIMDPALFEYENAFDITLGLTKAERLQVNESAMTHAMVISAVHLDSEVFPIPESVNADGFSLVEDGNPVRFKVENSWGPDVGDKGYFVMAAAWFDEFVYQVVVPRALAPKDLVKVYDGGNAVVLPCYDPMERTGPRFSIGFWGMVTAVMVSTEEEGRVALPNGEPTVYRDVEGGDEAVSLLNTDIPVTRPKRKRAKCCMCCGLDCGLFWKAIGIVIALFAAWNAFKLIRWAVTPSPTGLEEMPEYSTSLGCLSAEYIYSEKPTTFSVPIGAQNADHGFDTRGGAVGTITVLEGAETATKVTYEVVIRSDDKALLNDVNLEYPSDQDTAVGKSHLRIVTPRPDEGKCIRYDVKMYVPPTLKKLHLASHTISHVQFDPESHIQLDDFFVTLFSPKRLNMILPHNNLRSHNLQLEVYEGWIVGDVSIETSTKITTQRGAGVLNVRVHPTPSLETPELATLRTTSGSGRTDIFYVNKDAQFHRPISSTHMSSMNADMYLTYRDAKYSGLIELSAKSYTATGAERIAPFGEEPQDKWTHWVGDKEGKDELTVKTRGWAGVYF
ncbi:peptidase C1-like family-domain-containing protein [Favolaschia claudopus]|uniref:Cysteine proteinase 1, mitochondrial n=1 Tax=Favolaschia claudopus TaxID=2862362 RepID=A0AAW0DZ41_9AGAR